MMIPSAMISNLPAGSPVDSILALSALLGILRANFGATIIHITMNTNGLQFTVAGAIINPALCFHPHANPFSRNTFIFTSMQKLPGGVPPVEKPENFDADCLRARSIGHRSAPPCRPSDRGVDSNASRHKEART